MSDEVNYKTKVVCNHRFFLRIFSLTDFDLWKCLKKFWWGGGRVVGFLNIVSSPGYDFVKVKARFGQLCD